MGCMISTVLWLRMFFGMKPFFFIADADLLKDITVKHFDKFANRLVSDCTVCICCLTSFCVLIGGSCTGQAKWMDR